MAESESKGKDKKRSAGRHRMLTLMDSALEKRPVQFSLAAVLVVSLALLVGPSLVRSDSAGQNWQPVHQTECHGTKQGLKGR